MLTGRVALVTGGNRGIGRAIALTLAENGAAIAIAARSSADTARVVEEITERGGRAAGVTCDVTSAASVASAVSTTEQTFGGVTILVNNAGIAESAPLADVDEALWSRIIAVNLTGTYLCTRTVLPGMLAARYGRIINIASTAARTGYAYSSPYCAAKHGVVGFTRALALELATKGITVNSVCPGFVDTEMTAASIGRIAGKTGRSAADARAALEHMSPQRRLIQPEEVARVVAFLAGDEAHGITGQAINVDGGEVLA